jgi:hypothetical protein
MSEQPRTERQPLYAEALEAIRDGRAEKAPIPRRVPHTCHLGLSTDPLSMDCDGCVRDAIEDDECGVALGVEDNQPGTTP